MPTTLTPYLSFDGNTREAFAFYEKALGARTFGMLTDRFGVSWAVNGEPVAFG